MSKIVDIVDEKLNSRVNVPDIGQWARREDFSIDWLSGVLPITDVGSVFRKLEYLSKNKITRRHFALSSGGLFNYSNRLCFLGKFYFQIAYNPAAVAADTIFTGQRLIGGAPAADFVTLKGGSQLTARERKDKEQAEKGLDDWDAFRRLSGELVRVPLTATDTGNNPGVYLSITGQGCSVLRSLGIFWPFCRWLSEKGFRCSRIDFAFDVKAEDNPIVPMLLDGFVNTAGHYTPGAAAILTYMVVEKNLKLYRNFYRDKARESWSMSFGKHSSHSGMFRMYDKYFELTSKNRENVEKLKNEGIDYWYRLEYEAHNDVAKKLFAFWIDHNQDACLSWFEAVNCCISPRYAASLDDARGKNPTHPVWVALRQFCIQQNHYFAQCSADELRERTAASYVKWCGSMRKSFYSILHQLLQIEEGDVYDYLTDGAERYDGDTFLTSMFGGADDELTSAFLAFVQRYRAEHGVKKTSPLAEDI